MVARRTASGASRAGSIVSVVALGLSTGCGVATGPPSVVRTSVPTAPSAVLPAAPVPSSTARKLPPGVFYLQAGPRSGDQWGVWEISGGREVAVTSGELGRRISGFAASRRGMIVTANTGVVADVGRWTRTGPVWLHPAGKPRTLINAVAPAISPDGTLAYLNGLTGVWTRSSWTARDRLVYRVPENDGLVQPAFGPHRMLAMIGPFWQNVGRHPDVVIRADDGKGPAIGKLRSGFTKLGYAAFWGPGAPALVVGSSDREFELLFLSGKRELLPAGWRPLAWNPAGSKILMASRTSLRIWSLSQPHQVQLVGPVSHGYSIIGGEWLRSPAAGL